MKRIIISLNNIIYFYNIVAKLYTLHVDLFILIKGTLMPYGINNVIFSHQLESIHTNKCILFVSPCQ